MWLRRTRSSLFTNIRRKRFLLPLIYSKQRRLIQDDYIERQFQARKLPPQGNDVGSFEEAASSGIEGQKDEAIETISSEQPDLALSGTSPVNPEDVTDQTVKEVLTSAGTETSTSHASAQTTQAQNIPSIKENIKDPAPETKLASQESDSHQDSSNLEPIETLTSGAGAEFPASSPQAEGSANIETSSEHDKMRADLADELPSRCLVPGSIASEKSEEISLDTTMESLSGLEEAGKNEDFADSKENAKIVEQKEDTTSHVETTVESDKFTAFDQNLGKDFETTVGELGEFRIQGETNLMGANDRESIEVAETDIPPKIEEIKSELKVRVEDMTSAEYSQQFVNAPEEAPSDRAENGTADIAALEKVIEVEARNNIVEARPTEAAIQDQNGKGDHQATDDSGETKALEKSSSTEFKPTIKTSYKEPDTDQSWEKSDNAVASSEGTVQESSVSVGVSVETRADLADELPSRSLVPESIASEIAEEISLDTMMESVPGLEEVGKNEVLADSKENVKIYEQKEATTSHVEPTVESGKFTASDQNLGKDFETTAGELDEFRIEGETNLMGANVRENIWVAETDVPPKVEEIKSELKVRIEDMTSTEYSQQFVNAPEEDPSDRQGNGTSDIPAREKVAEVEACNNFLEARPPEATIQDQNEKGDHQATDDSGETKALEKSSSTESKPTIKTSDKEPDTDQSWEKLDNAVASSSEGTVQGSSVSVGVSVETTKVILESQIEEGSPKDASGEIAESEIGVLPDLRKVAYDGDVDSKEIDETLDVNVRIFEDSLSTQKTAPEQPIQNLLSSDSDAVNDTEDDKALSEKAEVTGVLDCMEKSTDSPTSDPTSYDFENFPDIDTKKQPLFADLKVEQAELKWTSDDNFIGKRREPRIVRKGHRYRRVKRDDLDPWEPRGTDKELQEFNQKILKWQSFDSKAQLVMAKARKLYMDFDENLEMLLFFLSSIDQPSTPQKMRSGWRPSLENRVFYNLILRSLPSDHNNKWTFLMALNAKLKNFTHLLADQLALQVDGTTIVHETASPCFAEHSLLYFMYNNKDFEDLLDILTGSMNVLPKEVAEDSINMAKEVEISKLPSEVSTYDDYRKYLERVRNEKKVLKPSNAFTHKEGTAAGRDFLTQLKTFNMDTWKTAPTKTPLYEAIKSLLEFLQKNSQKEAWKQQVIFTLTESKWLLPDQKDLAKSAENIYSIVIAGFFEISSRRLAFKNEVDNLVREFDAYREHLNKEGLEKPIGEAEKNAIRSIGFLRALEVGVPPESPIRLPEYYHDIEDGDRMHLKQHYYRTQYLPMSHPLRAPVDSILGVDRYRDDFIQRVNDRKRILETRLRLSYHSANQWKKGAFPLLNFPKLSQMEPKRHRIGVRKSTFVNVEAQENYQIKTYRTVASNFKLTSNRSADMFLAREYGVMYRSERVM